LYNTNYAQPQSQTTSAAAGAVTNTVQAQQTQAPQELGADLKNGMTLGDAMKKYLPLKVDPHDIYKQYLAGNTFGKNKTPKAPVESPEQLINMGIPADALGKVGENGTVQDRWNTGSIVEELRKLNDLWGQTKAANLAPNKIGYNAASEKYLTARALLGEHISTAVGGAPGGETTAGILMGVLPDSTNLMNYSPDVAKGKFDTAEQMLMLQKRYGYDDVYTNPPTTQSGQSQTPQKGGDILRSLLGMVANPVINAANKTTQENSQMPNAKGDPLQAILNAGGATANFAKNTIGNPDILGEAATLATIPDGIGALKAAPEVLAKILGKGAVEEGGAALANAPGKLSQFLTPNKAKATIGAIRDNLISTADKTGATIKGEDVANSIRQWADKAKLSNLPDADAIEQAAVNATKHYAGQVFKPSDLKNIYDGIETGYTKAGVLKSSASSFIDTGIKKIIADQVENVAPGFQKTSELFSKVFNGEKSSAGKIIKNLPQGVVRTGLNVAGLGAVGKLLGL
jgi:hypothetical protein